MGAPFSGSGTNSPHASARPSRIGNGGGGGGGNVRPRYCYCAHMRGCVLMRCKTGWRGERVGHGYRICCGCLQMTRDQRTHCMAGDTTATVMPNMCHGSCKESRSRSRWELRSRWKPSSPRSYPCFKLIGYINIFLCGISLRPAEMNPVIR